MRKGKLTRAEAIKIAGFDAVNRLDGENCDFSNRVQTDGDTAVEFEASVEFVDEDGTECCLIAYYYQEQDDLAGVEDLSLLDWDIEGYEVI